MEKKMRLILEVLSDPLSLPRLTMSTVLPAS